MFFVELTLFVMGASWSWALRSSGEASTIECELHIAINKQYRRDGRAAPAVVGVEREGA